MVFGSNILWRYSEQRDEYSICDGVTLSPGVLLFDLQKVTPIEETFYSSTCYGYAPVYSTFRRIGVETIPLMAEQWSKFVHTESGSFKYSIYPIIYSITVSTVMCLFLTIIVFTNHTQKPSWLLRISSLLASVNLCILFVRSIVFLSKEYKLGYSSGEKLLSDLQSDKVFDIIDFVFVLIAQLSQVQVIIRLFSRVKEKRVSFILGGFLSICSQVIWGVSTFNNFKQNDTEESDISILPAFTYLLRIALSMMYSGLILIYSFWKRYYIFNSSILLLTILTGFVINLQAAFFIVDISNLWVSELSEIFNTTIYVSATLIPWEWVNRVHVLQRKSQREGVLGRPVYEDESDIIKYEIIDNNTSNNNNNNNNSNNNFDNFDLNDDDDYETNDNDNDNENERSLTPKELTRKLKSSIKHTTKTFWYFTDQVIAYGLAIPRSVSVSTTDANIERPKRSNRKDVFVYSKKEVVCDSDNEQSI